MSTSAAEALDAAPLLLFSDRGCPFAHRVLALLDHLGQTPERSESEIGETPAGLSRYSSSGRIPLLVHGDLVITESRVMLEHLAEHFGLADALPLDLARRTQHRHAMALVDDFLAPLLFRRTLEDAARRRLDDVLSAIELALPAEVAPCLLAFHVAPIWLRFRWWAPSSPVTRAIEARPALCAWLDAATELDAIVRTRADRETQLAELERARSAGLLPPDSGAGDLLSCAIPTPAR